ncbi:MAG TPA: hypothetical protein VKK61_08150, partial [Tepidisphaeraceae bacterium]|nr:hypothetical protein [Tepidisphaeraceae bacterium]
MRRHLIGVILAVLLVAPALGQPLADRVPNDALVYIGWRGGSDVPAQYADSHLKAVLDNCKIRELFSQFLPQAVARFSASNPQARQPLETMQYILSQVWSHPTAFYFAGVAINTPQPMPKLAIICQAGTDAAAIQQRIQTLLDSSGEPTPIRCFVADDFVIVAIGYMQAADAMAVPGSGLATSSSFTTAMKQVQADPVFAAYVDVEKVLDIVESMAQLSPDEQAREKVPKAIDALGLRGLKRIVCTSGFDGKDWMSQTFVDAPSPRTGLLEMLDAAPISPDLLKSIPADSTFVATMRFDAAKLITKIREAAGQVDPRAQQIVDMATGAVQVALAKNPLTDVLQPLGEDWAIYCSPSVAGNGALEIVGVNHLNDPAKAQASLPTASINLSNWIAVALAHERSQVTITEKSTQIDGQRIYYFGLPIVAPAWTINNGNLYFGLYPQTAAAAARWTTLNQPSILDNEKFVALQKRLGVSNACSVSFYDLPATISNGAVYQQWLVIDRYCGFGDLFGLTLPEPLLPMMNILQQHLSPAGSAAWVDAAGYHSKSISPFPGSTLLSEPGMLTC